MTQSPTDGRDTGGHGKPPAADGNGPAADGNAHSADSNNLAADGKGHAVDGKDVTAGGRDAGAVGRFVERFAAVMAEAGFPPMAARVLAALLATDAGQLTAAGLAAQLRASPASISGGVRYLIQLGLVSKEREPGSRRDRYRVIDDIWYQSAIRQDSVLTRWVITASEGLDVLGADSPAGRRIGESVEYFAFMQREIPGLLARWREYRQSLPAAADQ